MPDTRETLERHIERTGSVLAEDTPYVVEVLAENERLVKGKNTRERRLREALEENERLRAEREHVRQLLIRVSRDNVGTGHDVEIIDTIKALKGGK